MSPESYVKVQKLWFSQGWGHSGMMGPLNPEGGALHPGHHHPLQAQALPTSW